MLLMRSDAIVRGISCGPANILPRAFVLIFHVNPPDVVTAPAHH